MLKANIRHSSSANVDNRGTAFARDHDNHLRQTVPALRSWSCCCFSVLNGSKWHATGTKLLTCSECSIPVALWLGCLNVIQLGLITLCLVSHTSDRGECSVWKGFFLKRVTQEPKKCRSPCGPRLPASAIRLANQIIPEPSIGKIVKRHIA